MLTHLSLLDRHLLTLRPRHLKFILSHFFREGGGHPIGAANQSNFWGHKDWKINHSIIRGIWNKFILDTKFVTTDDKNALNILFLVIVRLWKGVLEFYIGVCEKQYIFYLHFLIKGFRNHNFCHGRVAILMPPSSW